MLDTRELLAELAHGADLSRNVIQRRARQLLRHYPTALHLEFAGYYCPSWFQLPANPTAADDDGRATGIPHQASEALVAVPPLISQDPELLGGQAVFAGSRLPVLACLAVGEEWERMEASWPWLTPAHVDAALEWLNAKRFG